MLGTWLVLVALVLTAWWYSKWRHSYWARKGVPSPPTLPFLGHFHKIFTTQRWMFSDQIYKSFGKCSLFGLYEGLNPVLVLCHPDLYKSVLIKDFDYFMNRRPMGGEQPGSLTALMLGNAKGQDWRALRSVMSPTFSSGKMRRMYPLVDKISDTLVTSCLQDAKKNPSVDIKDKFGRYAMDTIASCAFGIECNSLIKAKPLFAQHAENMFHTPPLTALFYYIMFMFPKLFNALGLSVDTEPIQFFQSRVEETIKDRYTGMQRDFLDMIDLLLEARAEDTDTTNADMHVLNDKSIVAQCVMFLFIAFDTTSSSLSFSSHLLAQHPEHQETLRREIEDLVNQEGGLTYQGVMEAKFLDACIMESLRLYPPIQFVDRVCTKDYSIPGTKLHLKAGDPIHCPIWSIHHDPQYWPDPEEFRPERFLPENKGNIKSCTHLPFGLGPRNCIALRFSMMEMKLSLAKLVLAADFRIQPGHEDIILEKSPLLLRPQDHLRVFVHPRKQE